MPDSPQPQFVLGVNAGPHDAAAALLRDGEIMAMVEQERLSRRRYALGESPADAIASCLQEGGIELESVSEIAVGWNVPQLAEVEGMQFDEDIFGEWLLGALAGKSRPPVSFVDHHLAHAASAFYTSGMSRAVIIVADGRGETAATTLAVGGPSGIEVIRTWGTEHSLGHYYGWASEWAGLGLWGTGKLMGLAAYGEPSQTVPLTASPLGYSMTARPPENVPTRYHFALHRRALRAWFRSHNYPFAQGHPDDVMAHAQFAASVQRSLEDALVSVARMARAETGLRNIVLAGGVAMNCSANGVLLDSGLFDEVWVPPFANDAGVSVGAALLASGAGSKHPVPEKLRHAFLAPETPAVSLGALNLITNVDVAELPDDALAAVVAGDIAEGALIGWFEGRAEVGQRALGARSILCDPRNRNGLVAVNLLKGREPWRPLAPAILVEEFSRFMGREPFPMADFMLAALPVMEGERARIPGAVHVDGTTRPQVVRPSDGRYYKLIHAFHDLTGVPALINTSFNVGGSPIVFTVEDALMTFGDSDLDGVVFENYYVRKRGSRRSTRKRPDLTALSFTPWISDLK